MSAALDDQAAASGPLGRLGRGFARFFASEQPVAGAVAYRVLFALWTMAFWGPRLPHAWELYARPVLRYVHKTVKWLEHPLPPLWLVQLALVLLLALLAGFAFSRRPRVFHLLLLPPMFFLYALDTLMPRAYGALAFILWCLLFFAPYDRLRDDDGKICTGPVTGVRLLQLQWASVYFFTVPSKLLGGSGWVDGHVLWRTFHSTRYGDWLLSHWIDIPLWACQVGCWMTLASEMFVALGIWFRPTRRWAMLVALLLHLGMTLTLRVSLLFPTLMLLHVVLFVTNEEWDRFFRWVDRRLGRPPRETGLVPSGSS